MKMDMKFFGTVYNNLVENKYTVTDPVSTSELIGDTFTYAYAEYSGDLHKHLDTQKLEDATLEAINQTIEESLVKAGVLKEGDARIAQIAKAIFDKAKADAGKGGAKLILYKAFDETKLVVKAFCMLNQ